MELSKKYSLKTKVDTIFKLLEVSVIKVINSGLDNISFKNLDKESFYLVYGLEIKVNRMYKPNFSQVLFSQDHIDLFLDHCSKKDIFFDRKSFHHKLKPYSLATSSDDKYMVQLFGSKKEAKKMFKNYIYLCLLKDLDLKDLSIKVLKKQNGYFRRLYK